LFCRLLAVASDLNQQEAVKLLVSKGVLLDFPRLFMVLIANHHRLSDDRDWKSFMHAAQDVYGHLAEHLEQWVKSAKRWESLTLARKELEDPELRFFLALLLN